MCGVAPRCWVVCSAQPLDLPRVAPTMDEMPSRNDLPLRAPAVRTHLARRSQLHSHAVLVQGPLHERRLRL
jgi:hypothetical protein